jgi:hypothetical protein
MGHDKIIKVVNPIKGLAKAVEPVEKETVHVLRNGGAFFSVGRSVGVIDVDCNSFALEKRDELTSIGLDSPFKRIRIERRQNSALFFHRRILLQKAGTCRIE